MTINEAIAAVNVALSVSLIALGLLFFLQAALRRRLREWPPSALVALGIVPLLTGIVFAQQVFFRVSDLPEPFGQNEWGTLAFRALVTLVVIWKLGRVWRDKLLTPQDRTKIERRSP